MIVPAPLPSFYPSPPWPQVSLDGHQELESTSRSDFSPVKKQRVSENDHLNTFHNQPVNPRTPSSISPPVIKGIGKMFFKTRICEKFMQGTCPYGSNCNFAHGAEEIRKPPPNWKEIMAAHGDERGTGSLSDHQRIINRLRICRKFYYGEGCPYGNKCTFLHEEPEKMRESITVMVNTNGNWPEYPENNEGEIPVQESRSSDGVVISVVDGKSSSYGVVNSSAEKPVYWKTKICNKWETTGHCPFGEKCHFAHGQADLQKFGGVKMEADGGNVIATSKPSPASVSYISPTKSAAASKMQSRSMRLAKLNGPSLISRVYADWLDDLELDGLPGR